MRPLWIICEDGTEYADRFTRFLDGEFRFAAAADGALLLAALSGDGGDAEVAGVILDLDFRRTPPERLVDEAGRPLAGPPSEELRRRLAATQGIFILRLVRAAGHRVPVLLFADLDDGDQGAWLERTLGPLAIVPGHESLVTTAARMRAASAG